MSLLAIRIPIPHELVWPLLIGLGVLTVAGLVLLRLQAEDWGEWWNGPKHWRDHKTGQFYQAKEPKDRRDERLP